MRIDQLYVYPLKGAAGIALPSARLDTFGIVHDRRWMVTDPAGRFITQRDVPSLGRLVPVLEPDALVLRSATAGELRMPLHPGRGATLPVRVWHDDVAALDTGADSAAFISAHIGAPARIVHMPDDVLRQADTDYARVGDRVSFADGFPLLLIGRASLEDLERRVGQPLGMRRFRPNIVADTDVPYAEDAWQCITIGPVECDVVKPCARCVVTTLDPDTGVAGREPLATLASYRRIGSKVYFGQNVIHRGTGTIAVGDAITVTSAGAPRPDLGAISANT